mmetsp:Transcript_3042/g.4095  ORF Transcript_3042/g.4095 Transcript_3042/m.4095 type:complete len:390 (-) Transcript_3042:57-1226(-)|eukprot:CAMPEP_0198142474 /NCGR_PEP_ID=MMETSP1443-20131203/5253_1 /TAXON_ID=186043 /ORGANISM="Entomoneis sp., Strain CCMP2396" /LENGTH=389 /DNA_ID=CAMNT_0043805489 /DNA_START=118 /DNA_END=1287 /DNA_ORIENTATION=+
MEEHQSGEGGNIGKAFDGTNEVPFTKKRKLSVSQSPQMDALKTIYASLGGPEWTRQNNWLYNDHECCEWQGLTCKGDNVKILELSQNNLRGRLDDPILVDAFAKLGPTLEQLWISENAITGNLPSIFANESVFPHLNIIDVGSNQLRGSLHPAFAKRATPFSYLDTSGNQLTSYYRYNNSNNNDQGESSVVDDWPMSSPLPHVHVAPSLLTKPQCTHLVSLAMHHAEANGGWTMDRHKAYKTTDVDIAICGDKILDSCNDHLRTTILPLMARLFKVSLVDLVIEDLFLAKYSAGKGQQRMLSKHTDDSELSFVITLNDGFKGGGTRFINDDTTVAPNCGGGAFFCGHRLHSGVEVVEGERYILAGFVRVYPSTPKGVARLDCILKETKG